MKPRVLLALVSIFRTTVARAIPSSGQTNLSASSGHGTVVNHSKPYYLQTKYWLNASAEYKYFQEPGNDEVHAHYDSRFFKEPVPKEQHSQTLTHIIHSYFKLFNGNNLETWIAHGTQLGWWWNGKVCSRLSPSSAFMDLAHRLVCRLCPGTGISIPRFPKPRYFASPMISTEPKSTITPPIRMQSSPNS